MKTRIHSLDLYKFMLSFVILLLHANYIFLPQGYLATDSFFLISGVLLYYSRDRIKKNPFKESVYHRFMVLYPMYAIIIIIGIDMLHGYYAALEQAPILLSMLQMAAVKGLEYNFIGSCGYLWFVPVYLLVWITLAYIIKHKDEDKALLYTVLIMIFSISFIEFGSASGGINYSAEITCFPVHIGYLRGFVAMPMGYICGSISERAEKIPQNIGIKSVLAVVEAAAIAYHVYVFKHEITVILDYNYIVVSALLITLLCARKGYVSIFLDRISGKQPLKYLCGLSMPVYFIHYPFVNEYVRYAGEFVPEKHIFILIAIVLVCSALLSAFNNMIQKRINIPKLKGEDHAS